jgi:uncharacterized protein (DUF2267 family)
MTALAGARWASGHAVGGRARAVRRKRCVQLWQVEVPNDMANENRRGVSPELREQRHESRTSATFKEFIRHLAARGGFKDEADAVRSAASVLTHLDHRLTSDEAKDLRAQLPVKLQEMLDESRRVDVEQPVHKLHKEDFVACVASDLGRAEEDAESIIRAVFATVRAHISEGEADDVAAQLPRDLEPLWMRPS